MFTWDGMELTFSMPENFLSMFRWYHLFFISGAYGLITHLKTLPGVRAYVKSEKADKQAWEKLTANERVDKEILPFKLLLVLFARMTFVLPYRIVMFVIGLAWLCLDVGASLFCLFIAGAPTIRNEALRLTWQWHLTPKQIDY